MTYIPPGITYPEIQKIADERDRYLKCLEELAQTYSGSHWVGAKVRKALGMDRSA